MNVRPCSVCLVWLWQTDCSVLMCQRATYVNCLSNVCVLAGCIVQIVALLLSTMRSFSSESGIAATGLHCTREQN